MSKDWDDILSINLDGVFNVTRAFLDQLRSTAKIEKFNIDGSKPEPKPATPATPAAPAPATPPK